MDYSQILNMREELSLIAVLLILFIVDLFVSPGKKIKSKKELSLTLPAVILMLIHTGINIVPHRAFELFGGMYQYFPAQSIIKTVLNIGTIIVLLMADTWLRRDDTKYKRGEFYTLIFSTLFGMYLMISAGHFLLFFIGLECASLPMAALAAFDKYHNNSAEAGAKYILTALFSSALLLFGISMIYGTSGTLYFNDLPQYITGNYMQLMAFAFFFAGMGFKISLVPFHLWTADVYEGAPTVVTSYLSVISKGSATFVLMVILIKVFAPIVVMWQEILFWITIVTITIANLFAIRQQNIKRFMAFSSISQAGYIMLGVINGNTIGLTALIYYVLVYAAANLGVFIVISIIEQRSGRITISDYNGLYKTNPKLSLFLTLSLFSLAGIPPFAGFFSKFFIFMAAFGSGFHLLVFIALVNTVISLYYYLLVVKAIYITPNETPIETIRSDIYSRIGMIICLIGIIGLGLFSIIFTTIGNYVS